MYVRRGNREGGVKKTRKRATTPLWRIRSLEPAAEGEGEVRTNDLHFDHPSCVICVSVIFCVSVR